MYRGLVRDYEWVLLSLMSGVGLVWGVVSLFVGFSRLFVEASGVLHAALTVFCLPLYLALWLGSALQLSVINPSGLVMATGVVLGLIAAVACLSVLRWRGR